MVAEQPLIKPLVVSDRAVVVSGNPLASRAGALALEKGGNIVDAAIAVSFALGVVEPDASGIGGDGMAILYLKGMTEPVAIDYKDQVPIRATRDNPLLTASTGDGPSAANIPGVVAGLDLLYRSYASKKIPWSDLVAPAIDYAETGYELDAALPTTIAEGRKFFEKYRSSSRIYLPDGKVPKAGDRFVNKDYAATLRTIAKDGAEAFYRGSIARRIADDMAKNGGLITVDDLAQYRAIERRPLAGRYRDHQIYSAPPPVSTGATLIETLQILENYQPKPGATYAPRRRLPSLRDRVLARARPGTANRRSGALGRHPRAASRSVARGDALQADRPEEGLSRPSRHRPPTRRPNGSAAGRRRSRWSTGRAT